MKIATITAAFMAAVLAVPEALAQVAGAYPVGQQVNVYVGTGPGGMNDTLMRLVARHIGKYMPGKPQVIQRNLPGAGGRKLATFLYNQAARNGTDIGIFQRSIVTDPLLVDEKLPFEMPTFTWIGSPSASTDVCAVWHTSPVQSIDDLKKTDLIIAGSGGETAQTQMLVNLIGAKMRAVIGYTGGQEMNLALERGEAFGRCAISWEAAKTIYADLLEQKKLRPIVQFAMARHVDLPNVPVVMDFANSDIDKKALEILLAPQEVGFPFVAPPGLSAEVKDMLRTAFDEAMRDPALLEEAKKFQFDVAPVSGQKLEAQMAKIYSYSPDIVARARALIVK